MRFPKGLSEWLLHGERGISSEAIVSQITGFNICHSRCRGIDHPRDPADFRRCRELLETVPYCRRHLDRMKTRSPIWARLVECWDELERLYVEECLTGTCHKLYEKMQALTAEEAKP